MIIGRMDQYSKGGGLETYHPRRQNAAHGFARSKLAFTPPAGREASGHYLLLSDLSGCGTPAL